MNKCRLLKKTENYILSKNVKNDIKCSTEVPVSPLQNPLSLDRGFFLFLLLKISHEKSAKYSDSTNF